jgi:polyisoprenyl-phosphate glycosyltransferase
MIKINISIVIPFYNEDENINLTLNQVIKFFNLPKYEFLIIDNGSTDNTLKHLKLFFKKNKKFIKFKYKLIILENNRGYSGGILYGLRKASGKLIGWTHGDGQTPLKDIKKIEKKIANKNYKKLFAKGTRVSKRTGSSTISSLHEKCSSILLRKKFKDINGAPKIFSRDLMRLINEVPNNYCVLDTYLYYLALCNNYEIIDIKVKFMERTSNISKFTENYWTIIKHIVFNFFYLFYLMLKGK